MPDQSVIFAKTCNALRQVIRERTAEIRPEHHLVDDLGCDSMHMASLTIALEDEFDDVLLLNDWIAAAHNPGELTVSSLVNYLEELLRDGG